jgi:hypothetical protein
MYRNAEGFLLPKEVLLRDTEAYGRAYFAGFIGIFVLPIINWKID